MRILGLSFLKISADRKEKYTERPTLNADIKVDNVEKESVPNSSDELLRVYFTFKLLYQPNIATIEIKGCLVILPNEEEKKKISKLKDKNLPNELKIPIFNFLFEKCSLKSIELEDQLGLPIHIPFPRLESQEKKNN